MSKVTSRIVGPAQVATGPTTVYTVPAGTLAILRYLRITNPTGAPVTFTMSIGADGVTTRVYTTYSIPAAAAGVSDSVRDVWLNIPMSAAEILTVSAGTNNALVIVVTADLITLG